MNLILLEERDRVDASSVTLADARATHLLKVLRVTTGQTVRVGWIDGPLGTGTVESVSVMRDMATGRARGFAFVQMASDEDAQNAINQFHNYSLGGRNLTVNEARPKPQSSGGYGGGGGGGGRGGRREPRW